MHTFKKLLLTSAILASTTAYAADDVADKKAEKKPYSLDAEFGFLSTTGNTETQNLNLLLDGKYTYAQWLHNLILQTYSTEAEDTRTAEKYLGRWKSDYNFNDAHYIFGILLYEKDRFSGYEYESSINAGYGYKIFDTEKYFWDVEGGVGYRDSRISHDATEKAGEKESEYLIRPATTFKYHFTEHSAFTQFFSAEIGEDKTVSRSVTSLKAHVMDNLAMKLTYAIKHTDKVPTGFEKTDTETAVTLVLSY